MPAICHAPQTPFTHNELSTTKYVFVYPYVVGSSLVLPNSPYTHTWYWTVLLNILPWRYKTLGLQSPLTNWNQLSSYRKMLKKKYHVPMSQDLNPRIITKSGCYSWPVVQFQNVEHLIPISLIYFLIMLQSEGGGNINFTKIMLVFFWQILKELILNVRL